MAKKTIRKHHLPGPGWELAKKGEDQVMKEDLEAFRQLDNMKNSQENRTGVHW